MHESFCYCFDCQSGHAPDPAPIWMFRTRVKVYRVVNFDWGWPPTIHLKLLMVNRQKSSPKVRMVDTSPFFLIFIKKLDFNWRNTWLFEFDSDLWAGGVRSTFWRSWWTGKLEFRVLKLAIDRIEMGCRSLIKLHGTILWNECPFRIASEYLFSLIRRKLRRTFTVNLLLLGN